MDMIAALANIVPASESAAEKQPSFILKMADETMLAYGTKHQLAAGPLDGFSARVDRHFAEHGDRPGILVGAIPFDPAHSAHLVQPARMLRVQGDHEVGGIPGLATASAPLMRVPVISVTPEPTADAFGEAVNAAIRALDDTSSGLHKLVLSRCLKVRAGRSFSAGELLRRLASDASASVFITALPDKDGKRILIGATPELLLDKRGHRIVSHPLAGSAPRSQDPAEDRAAGEHLLSSAKDQHEHSLVVQAIMDVLSPYCSELSAPGGTTLRATASLWHLGTRLVGRLRDPATSCAELAALLHPTPAVCGLPRQAAHAAIGALEPYDRDFYAGAVGWCDSSGDGRWFVSIRCAEIRGEEARLYAGAGIVPGSTAEGEIAETAAKFSAMLHAFGLEGEDVERRIG
ncbi:isochorismate synthase [Afifella marina]|uniref:isochorismate synthase n=1 Tax=Afifella marina DSM 2698 TaxID=1120955 RepID=A0A1G5NTK4_AFIMA|nr:isochorismate synthase [Afifella marina]SCZ40675.1 isochorismate synthase [Afifella marina DSM 2698]